MARIVNFRQQPVEPRSIWPWGGGPRSIREKLVDPTQFERKRRKKLGDPKSPSLASFELLEFMGPGHASDELRLPPPPTPFGEATSEPTYFPDREATRSAIERGSRSLRTGLEQTIARLQAAPDKLERMRAVIHREAQMISLVSKVQEQVEEIIEKMKIEYKANGQY